MPWSLLSLGGQIAFLLASLSRLRAVRALERLTRPHLARGAPAKCSEDERREYVAALNEVTIELSSGLSRASVVPRSCARAALSLGALVALLQASELASSAPPRPWLAPGVALLGGCAAALGCSFVGRAAEARARRLRAEWATLIRRATQDVAT